LIPLFLDVSTDFTANPPRGNIAIVWGGDDGNLIEQCGTFCFQGRWRTAGNVTAEKRSLMNPG